MAHPETSELPVAMSILMQDMLSRLGALEAGQQDVRAEVAQVHAEFASIRDGMRRIEDLLLVDVDDAPVVERLPPVLVPPPPVPPEPPSFRGEDEKTGPMVKLADWWSSKVTPVHLLAALGLLVGGPVAVGRMIGAAERYYDVDTPAVVRSIEVDGTTGPTPVGQRPLP